VKRFVWIDAQDVAGALQAGAQPGAIFKAGGVDLADRLKEQLDEPEALVNLRRLGELKQMSFDKMQGLALGPLLTLAQLADSKVVQENALALAQAAGAAATPQIRNMATLGGNLAQRPRCWYFRSELFHCRKKGGTTCFAQDGEHEFHSIFDNAICAAVHPSGTATALVALDARVRLRSAQGARSLPIEALFVTPEKDVLRENQLQHGELISEVIVPAPVGARSAYSKLMQKQSFDWPLAEVAVAVRMDGKRVQQARVVLGSAAPVPHRAHAAEKALIGNVFDDHAIDAAARAAVEEASPLPRNVYKVPLFEALVRRTLRAAREET
jgi:xanthine dehydrogenase YagS FAD-binding subunit